MSRPRLPKSLAELHGVAARVEARIKQLQVQRRAIEDEVRAVDSAIRQLKGQKRTAESGRLRRAKSARS